MKTLFAAVIISLLATNAIAQPKENSHEPEKPENEHDRLGLQAGYVATSSDLKDTFGNGFNLTLHWVQHIRHPFFVDLAIGAFYMGSTGRDDITQAVFQQNFDKTSMRILRFTVAPYLEFPISDRTAGYFSIGGGLYTVSLLIDEAFSEFDLTNNHWGASVGGGIVRRITNNWFLEIRGELHKMWTSAESDDLFFLYSEGDQDPLFYQVTVGTMLRLF